MAANLERRAEALKERAAKRKAALKRKLSAGTPAAELRHARKLLKRAQRGARKVAAVRARIAAAGKRKESGEGES